QRWHCNRGDRCNRPNHHKPNNRPNQGSQIRRFTLFSPQGLSPQRGVPVSSRGLYDRQKVSVRSLGGLSPAGQELGQGAWHRNAFLTSHFSLLTSHFETQPVLG
ncbi:MAG: hypothetical protein ACKO2P_14890, partial [Planctomycetota bacterium]